MAYCTSAQLEAQISELGQAQTTAETGTSIDATILDEVIDQAGNKMNLYLMAKYTVPITAADALPILVPICVTIATYLLYKRRLIASKNDQIVEDYKLAIEELKMIREDGGLPGLGDSAIGTEPAIEDYEPIVGSETQVFGTVLQSF